MKEQIIKPVVRSGNSGAVWVPRNWLGENVLVIRIEKPINWKERLFKILKPYLEKIIGVFIYGSYARKEETSKSDIDILIIVKNKEDIPSIKEQGFHIQIIELDKLKGTIENNPTFYYSIIQEAVPLINQALLDELKQLNINYKKFKWFIQTTKNIIKMNKESLDLDRLDGNYLESYGIIYTLILRLRGVFLINNIIQKKKPTNKLFKKWILKNIKIPISEYSKIYNIYRIIRDDKKINKKKNKINIIHLESLLNFLIKENNKLEIKI